MTFKKKLTAGAMAATLGFSLVGVGTWAAFNDIEEVSAGVAAGELDLVINPAEGPINFDISNLKPGDKMTRSFELDNNGTLAIKEVLLSIDQVDFNDYIPEEGQAGFGDEDTYGSNDAEEYLDQFQVTLLRTGTEGAVEDIIVGTEQKVTLKDIYLGSDKVQKAVGNHWVDGRINLASTASNQWEGLPAQPHDFDTVEMTIEFVEYSDRDDRGVEDQNKYQGDTADITFSLEATQWDGQEITEADLNENGYITINEEANNGEN
ncbi:TasA family protein [Oceanobacillus salinisoli]|uniref:TasA family protein n=1 Tax=Oceanobacillus salinisoli TaxID=2678611 RepID=UPI0012E105C1|nr:TasA family protein [Oceanobacillus salinisoli]